MKGEGGGDRHVQGGIALDERLRLEPRDDLLQEGDLLCLRARARELCPPGGHYLCELSVQALQSWRDTHLGDPDGLLEGRVGVRKVLLEVRHVRADSHLAWIS